MGKVFKVVYIQLETQINTHKLIVEKHGNTPKLKLDTVPMFQNNKE